MDVPAPETPASQEQRGRQLFLGVALLLGLLHLGSNPLSRYLDAGLSPLRDRARRHLVGAGELPVTLLEVTAVDLSRVPTAWPWTRSTHARVLRELARLGARGVALDIDLYLSATSDEAEDRALLDALGAGPPVALLGAVIGCPGDAPLAPPLGTYRQAAAVVGPSGLGTDPTGALASLRWSAGGSPRRAPSWVRGLVEVLSPGPAPTPTLTPEGLVPLDLARRDQLVRFPVQDLLAGRIPPDAIRGRVVVYGPTATLLNVRRPTVAGVELAESEVLALALAEALEGRFLLLLPGWAAVGLHLALALALAWAGLSERRRAVAATCAVLLLAWWGGAAAAAAAGVLVPLPRATSLVLLLGLAGLMRERAATTEGLQVADLEHEQEAERLFHQALSRLEAGEVRAGTRLLEQAAAEATVLTPHILHRLTLARLVQDERTEARACLDRLDAGALESEELYVLARELERHGEKERARDLLARLIKREPAYRDASERLAELRHELARLSEDEVLEVVIRRLLDPRYHDTRVLVKGPSSFLLATHDRERGDEEVALKVLSPLQVNQDLVQVRFLREARGIAALDHPNLVRIHAVHDGRLPYYSMELVRGTDLEARLAAEGALPLREALGLFLQLCEGMAASHDAGIVHRDLKPRNLMVEPGGRLVILDFGVARFLDDDQVTQTGQVLGTPVYMSPEQVKGQRVDAQADVYAMGLILYEMLTGDPPFRTMTERLMVPAPPPPEGAAVPPALVEVLMRTLSWEPTDRPDGARALRDAVRQAAAASAAPDDGPGAAEAAP